MISAAGPLFVVLRAVAASGGWKKRRMIKNKFDGTLGIVKAVTLGVCLQNIKQIRICIFLIYEKCTEYIEMILYFAAVLW